jgi:hypothetical protein
MYGWNTKYYAEFKNTRGQEFTLYVDQRDYSGAVKKIGDFCGCVLEVQGSMDSVITPIVKTQLRFSMVDSSDKTDTQTTKYGDWQEFFTPDATLYIVSLFAIENNALTRIWSGYITPDSWKEDLDYRGIITVTARDCIGHLRDFPFEPTGGVTPDNNGLIYIQNIIGNAMYTINFPMTFEVCNGAVNPQSVAPIPVTTDGKTVLDAKVNAALFEGMNWYEVLEQTLDAIGYVCRFVGGGFLFAPLRDLPKLGNIPGDASTQTLEFYGGTLELDPAVKKIEEVQDYKHQEEVSLEHMAGLEFGSTTTYRCKTDGNTMPGGGTFSIPEHDADMNAVTDAGQTGWDVGSGMLDPSNYLPDDFLRRAEGEDGWRNYAFIASNQVLNGSSPSATFRFWTKTSALRLTFRFTPNPMTVENSGSATGKMSGKSHYSLAEIKYYLCYSNGSTTRWWTGGQWQNSSYLITKEFDAQNQYETDFIVELAECQDVEGGTLTIMFYQITYKMWASGGHGCYARVAEILTEINGTTALKSNKVTTINNDAYNVQLTRKPLFGALSKEMGFVNPKNYLAGMFYYTSSNPGTPPSLFPYQVKFNDQNDTVPLPVLIHQQILCYYYGAARILSGNCAPVNKAAFDFGKICVYKGHKYILHGGTLDYFSGIMTGSVLREYVDFEDLWDNVTPTYDEEVKYND